MRVGFTIIPSAFASPRTVVDLARDLDAAGTPVLTVNESSTEAFSLLGAIATVTSQTLLGTAIATTFMRHPFEMARAVAGVAALADGRFFLGIGPGRQDTVEDQLRAPYDRPVSRGRAYIQVLRACLETEGWVEVDAAPWYAFHGHGVRWRPADVAIILAALGDPMTRLAGEVADGAFTTLAATPQFPRIAALMREGAAKAGRPEAPCLPVAIRMTAVDDDPAVAIEAVRRAIGAWPPHRLYLEQFVAQGLIPEPVLTDEVVRMMGLAGTPAMVRASMEELAAAGVDTVLMAPVAPGDRVARFGELVTAGLHGEVTA